jgi:DnaK suppressor protein
VSKTPAPKAPMKKTAGKPTKAAAVAPPKPAAKPKAKAAAKPVLKAPVKPSAAKPQAKAAVAKKTPSSSKPAPAPARSKPVAAPTVAAKPAAASKSVSPPMKSAPPPVPVAPTPAAPVALKKPGRNASKYAAPAVQAPLPPPTSRFADRFAPPRPPTRQMNNVELDTPRLAQKSDPRLANAWKTKAGRELSEPELLAMPDAEYMNDKQLEFFRVKLQTLKDDLLSNAGETTEHLREDTSIVPDPADRATIEEEHALELRTRDRERKLLKKISQSLTRIESGEYGFCDETGEPIGLGRLIARPTATLSLEAQQRRELKQKMFGD